MIHKIVVSTFAFLALATCQNQNISENSATSEKTEIAVKPPVPSTKSTPVKSTTNDEPEMSTGLPPDKAAVKQAEDETNLKNTQNGMIYLKEGKTQFLKQYEMNVTFKKMIEDSRCPKDVQCIWAGNATAEVELMGLYTRPVTVRLSTTNDANKGYSKSQEFNGYLISLAELSPETTSDKGFNALKGSYKIGLKFEKDTNKNPSTQRGGTTTK